MSTVKSIKPHKRSRLLRMLEKLGIISRKEADKVEQEKEENPLEETQQILMNHGISKEDIELAQPVNGYDRSNNEVICKRQEAKDHMDETITTSIRLTDISAAIAAKANGK